MKKIIIIFTGILLCISKVNADEIFAPSSKSAILIEASTGEVLYEKNANEKLKPASMTKMMTLLLTFEAIERGDLKLTDEVIVSINASGMGGSQILLETGEKMTVDNLIKGVAIASGNDAAVALAEKIGGTEDYFVELMNKRATELGLKNTHFQNAHGIDAENHYSTAYDMALLGRAIIRDLPDEYPIYSQKEFTFNGIKQYNRNRLLWDNSMKVDGIKTGHLSQVGYNLVTSAVNDNMRLVAAVIGAKSEKLRANYNKALLTYGFRYFQLYTPVQANKPLLKREVRMGKQSQVDLVIAKDLNLLIPRGRQNDLKLSYRLKRSTFIAPLKKGDELGVIDVKLDDKVINSVPLVSAQDIEEGGFFGRMWDKICLFFSSNDEEVSEQK